IVEEGIKWVMNPYDEFAVEEALQLKEKFKGDSTVTIVSLGPQRAIEAIRTALAMGADKGVHIDDPALAGSDSFTVAKALAAALKDIPYDIILCGKQAVDDDCAQVPQSLAELLDLPQAMVVEKLEVADDGKKATAYRRIEGGAKEVLELTLPAVIAAEKGLNEPRYASLPGIMKAKSKEVKNLDLAALGMSAGDVGVEGSKGKILKYMLPPEKQPGKKIEGEPEETAKELVKLLREEAKII
ncbi:MAG: electron transfer flavoprotein subunit beta/FixA family protein, partial [Deltaproteobacteria bacterium]